MLLILCDNWKTYLFINAYCYPEIHLKSHFLVIFETSDLEEVRISFHIQNENVLTV